MGGGELGIDSRGVDDGKPGDERNERETPYPERHAPSTGEPSGGRELGGFHRNLHPDYGQRRAWKQYHHAADREPSNQAAAPARTIAAVKAATWAEKKRAHPKHNTP